MKGIKYIWGIISGLKDLVLHIFGLKDVVHSSPIMRKPHRQAIVVELFLKTVVLSSLSLLVSSTNICTTVSAFTLNGFFFILMLRFFSILKSKIQQLFLFQS